MIKEINNKERLRFGILEFMASGISITILSFIIPLWINNQIFKGYLYWIIGLILWYVVPLFLEGNHIIGKLLNFSILNDKNQSLSLNEIIIRQTLKLFLIMTGIDIFRMLLLPKEITFYDKLLRYKIIEN